MPDSTFSVFYVWESDLPAATNRNFIEDALKRAIGEIDRDAVLESAIRLDKDTLGVPGLPEIARTILDKISHADCVVCDVSYVGNTCTEEVEPIPNPNVMIELGYALSELGWERIILVLNEEYGTSDKLPFDLRNRRWPIRFTLPDEVESEEKRRVRTSFVSSLRKAILAIAELGERDKSPSLESQVYALQEIVSSLSTLGWNSESATRSEANSSRIVELRESLSRKLESNDFYGVSQEEGAILLVLDPVDTQKKLLLFDDMYYSETISLLKPLNSSSWDDRRFGDKLVTYAGPDDKNIDAAVECTDSGLICAAGHSVISIYRELVDNPPPPGTLLIPSVAYESRVIEAVFRYIQALQKLRVTGSLDLILGITGITRSQLLVKPSFAFDGRVFEGSRIYPPSIRLEDPYPTDPQELASAMRPIFDYIWREHNFPKSLNYARTGYWVGH